MQSTMHTTMYCDTQLLKENTLKICPGMLTCTLYLTNLFSLNSQFCFVRLIDMFTGFIFLVKQKKILAEHGSIYLYIYAFVPYYMASEIKWVQKDDENDSKCYKVFATRSYLPSFLRSLSPSFLLNYDHILGQLLN